MMLHLSTAPGSRRRTLRGALAALLAATVTACTVAPEPVHLGSDECAHCRMTISEPQFAGQVLNRQGRSFKFDSIECMVAYVAGGSIEADAMHSAWVADFDDPEQWVAVEDAVFVRSSALRSPMGGGLSGHGARSGAEALIAELGAGELRSWPELLAQGAVLPGGVGHVH